MSVAPATRVAMVRPARGIVIRGVTDLRARPDDDAELVDQAQFGETMTRLGELHEWTYVQGADLYFGWLRTADLGGLDGGPEQVVVSVPLARVRSHPSEDSDIVDELPVGASLLSHELEGVWWRIARDESSPSPTPSLSSSFRTGIPPPTICSRPRSHSSASRTSGVGPACTGSTAPGSPSGSIV